MFPFVPVATVQLPPMAVAPAEKTSLLLKTAGVVLPLYCWQK